MEWTTVANQEDGQIKIPDNWLLIHYYDALTALFRIENALRVFVYIVLKDKKKGQWPSLTITSDDGPQTTIASAAKKRIAQDDTFGYLGYSIKSPLMHLTSGELIRIILADATWPLFKPHFPASKDLVRTKLEEIGNIRNALAHFRPIKPDDVQVVKQNANQVLSKLENYIADLIDATSRTVPTNSQEPWYAELKTLGNQHCSFTFKQSPTETWIVIALRFKCPYTILDYSSKSFKFLQLLTINTPQLLKESPAILDNVVFFSEASFARYKDDELNAVKSARFYFSRETLRDSYQTLKPEFEKLLEKITTETELILEDNLAQGEFVRFVSLTASEYKHAPGRHSVDTKPMSSPEQETNPPEYWGTQPSSSEHLVTDTATYPWMPVQISTPDDIPF